MFSSVTVDQSLNKKRYLLNIKKATARSRPVMFVGISLQKGLTFQDIGEEIISRRMENLKASNVSFFINDLVNSIRGRNVGRDIISVGTKFRWADISRLWMRARAWRMSVRSWRNSKRSEMHHVQQRIHSREISAHEMSVGQNLGGDEMSARWYCIPDLEILIINFFYTDSESSW